MFPCCSPWSWRFSITKPRRPTHLTGRSCPFVARRAFIPSPFRCSMPWHQLRHLSIGYNPAEIPQNVMHQTVLDIMRRSPELETCTISMAGDGSRAGIIRAPIHLEKLHQLCLFDIDGDMGFSPPARHAQPPCSGVLLQILRRLSAHFRIHTSPRTLQSPPAAQSSRPLLANSLLCRDPPAHGPARETGNPVRTPIQRPPR
ncbi:hypothetical protein DFH09DRAFT_1431615 [Mycena vulgaris]|nr:hypothetical protein DFH09DRAFT_1431615 [Mycena vulgaris]